MKSIIIKLSHARGIPYPMQIVIIIIIVNRCNNQLRQFLYHHFAYPGCCGSVYVKRPGRISYYYYYFFPLPAPQPPALPGQPLQSPGFPTCPVLGQRSWLPPPVLPPKAEPPLVELPQLELLPCCPLSIVNIKIINDKIQLLVLV